MNEKLARRRFVIVGLSIIAALTAALVITAVSLHRAKALHPSPEAPSLLGPDSNRPVPHP